ncbi:MAG: aldehyde dehydrogenase family protein [Lamprobacter sp.]|uniref:aldehyde dehydrogenase family protein n=1 Tax=Lamprobacter sp. TaxID=3100796 RepID=UPI002B261614|nr:aldehyde dehydrogenase family protein [Lamprobacter sp.]MEA3642411.1 aldehyde dehydrogenase family protein [Lamprobacter sp.]
MTDDRQPHHGHRIAAEVSPTGSLEVLNPFNLQPIATVDTVDRQGVEQALAVAAACYRDRTAWLPDFERMAILRRAAELMVNRIDELALLIAREGGKPLNDARVEAERAVDGLRCCAELPRHSGGREVPMQATAAGAGRWAFSTHEPIGPVVAISAFNHPLNLIVHQLAPAVAAGCPVIVKPAEDTPLSCLRFIDLLREAGLPPAWAQALVTDSPMTAEALATDPRVAFLSFIGSARVGWHLRSRLAPGARCALEHGGVAQVLVDRGVDLQQVVPLLAKGGLYHAGQVCVSVQRVYVHQDQALGLAQALAETAAEMRVDDPTLAETAIGPLIRPAEVERVDQWVREAIGQGATLLCGGEPLSRTCYAPTVLFDPPATAKVSTQELFGPVICVYPYVEVDAAIEAANALPFAFQAAVFTRELAFARHAASRLAASAVMINDHTAFRTDWMPFAGLRQSGLGTGGMPYTFEDMRTEKLVVWRTD